MYEWFFLREYWKFTISNLFRLQEAVQLFLVIHLVLDTELLSIPEKSPQNSLPVLAISTDVRRRFGLKSRGYGIPICGMTRRAARPKSPAFPNRATEHDEQ